MLVVGSLRPIAHAVLRATRQWRWQLHGSQLAAPGAYNYLNAGFMAFRAPAPAALLRAVDAQLDKMVGEARFHPTPSQNLLNDVLPLGGPSYNMLTLALKLANLGVSECIVVAGLIRHCKSLQVGVRGVAPLSLCSSFWLLVRC